MSKAQRTFRSWFVEYLLRGMGLIAILFLAFVGYEISQGGPLSIQGRAFAESAATYWVVATPIIVAYAAGVALYERVRHKG